MKSILCGDSGTSTKRRSKARFFVEKWLEDELCRDARLLSAMCAGRSVSGGGGLGQSWNRQKILQRGSKPSNKANAWTRVNNPGGDGIDPSIARVDGAQGWGQCRHDQALVGAERSRVGIRLGLRVLSKPYDNTGTRRGKSESGRGTWHFRGPRWRGDLKMNYAGMKWNHGCMKAVKPIWSGPKQTT
jgi:hypothetical protein